MKSFAPRTHGGSSNKAPSQSNAPALKKQENPVLGWLSNSAAWASEQFNSTRNAISNWANGVSESAQELWDIAHNSNLAINKDSIDLNSDLDEILDILPDSLRQQIQLDRDRSTNEATLSYDRNSGEVVIKSPSVAINGVNIDNFSMKSGTLEGLEIRIQNSNGSLSIFNKDSFLDGQNNTSIHIDRALGTGVTIQSNDGPITAEEVSLSAIDIQVGGGQNSVFGNDDGQRSFKVESAAVKGLKTTDIRADNLDFTKASGQIGTDTASINAQQLSTSGFHHSEGSINHAAVRGLSAQFITKGDSTNAQVRATQSEMQGINSSHGQVESIQANNAQFSNTEGLSASADSLSVDNIDTDIADADYLNLSGVAVNHQNGSTAASIGQILANGIDTEPVDVSQVNLNDVSLNHSQDGLISQIAAVKGNGVNINETGSIDTFSAKNMHSNLTKSSQSGEFEQITLGGVRDNSDRGSIGSLSLNDGTLQHDTKGTSAHLGSAHLQDITAQTNEASAHVQSASLNNTHFAKDTNNFTFGADAAQLNSATLDAAVPKMNNDLVKMDTLKADGSLRFSDGAIEGPMMSSVASRIDSGQIQANVGLQPGKIEDTPLTILDNTNVNANVAIENNRLAEGTNVSVTPSIDAPLWFNIKGGGVDENERLKAKVGGWGDQDITKNINKAAGVSGSELHSIGAYAAGFDEQSNNGMEAQLNGADQGANQLKFSAEGQKISAGFAHFLASSLCLSGESGQFESGTTEAKGAQIVMDNKKGTAQGTIGQLNIQDISAKGQN